MQSFPLTETTFLLPGPVGDLEVLVTPNENSTRAATAIVCHPHPLYGGTMNNKVVTTLARTFRDLGLHVVRFNFRGIGKSVGQYAEGKGELDDLLAIVAWVKQVRPQDEIWLSGFSFGACIAAKAATQISVAQLVTIAPAVKHLDMRDLPPITAPWLLVQGENDEVVLPEDVYAWVETRDPQPKLIRLPGAGHFFHGQLMDLRRAIEANL